MFFGHLVHQNGFTEEIGGRARTMQGKHEGMGPCAIVNKRNEKRATTPPAVHGEFKGFVGIN